MQKEKFEHRFEQTNNDDPMQLRKRRTTKIRSCDGEQSFRTELSKDPKTKSI
jgi:hypothetical protein